MSPRRTITLTALALVGFAANSLLCRAALAHPGTIDPVTFTTLRVVSGALVLLALARGRTRAHGDAASALALFGYALPFSLAYVRVGGATGALLLFGTVQLTMFGGAIARGERPGLATYVGLVVAASGLVVLVAPGAHAPDLAGAALMIGAGLAWGLYSLRGRAATDALGATAGNFVRAAPLAVLVELGAAATQPVVVSARGVALAVTSGALASGLGYAIWYAVLPTLGATRASIVQLAVPIVAALAAVPLLSEPLDLRLVSAGLLAVLGIFVAIRARARAS